MIKFEGKYTTAKINSEEQPDENVQKKIYKLINHEAFTKPIIIMPDYHEGKGAVIGFTMEITDKIIPDIVGVDIGCGMLTLIFEPKLNNPLEEIDKKIRERIPFGNNVSEKARHFDDVIFGTINRNLLNFTTEYNKRFNKTEQYKPIDKRYIQEKSNEIGIDYERVAKSIGTLGGGNHFIEFGISQNTGNLFVTIHSGSRQFGYKIANYWQKKAGKDLSFLIDSDMYGYLCDMILAQEYARQNRYQMCHEIINILNKRILISIETVHNYINFKDFIIRKGAISSYEKTKMVIPLNMEDGILLCEGKSNPEWNYSAPHGAGRIGSRKYCKENFTTEPTAERMKEKGIYFSNLPIDEMKEAYKDPQLIIDSIKETATIIDTIKPIMACKDG